MSLRGKTLFITGASRGIGLAIGLRAARDGANVAIVAKTVEPNPKLPGTIFTAAKEIEEVADRTRAELESSGEPVEVSLSVPRVYFDSGAALEEAAKELGEPLNPDEVKQ